MSKRVFITGGAGYVGTMLVRKLLAEGYTVDSFDLMLFGNTLPKNSKLKIYEDVNIVKKSTNDNRSYHKSSKKIEKHLNFKFKRSIEDAIKDLKDAFIEKKIVDTFNDKKYFNIKILKDAKLV